MNDLTTRRVNTGFNIIQSNKIEKLLENFLNLYQQSSNEQFIFQPFQVIVPSQVMGDWLKKQVANQFGISTLVTTEFWGRFYWQLLKKVVKNVSDEAPLSKNVMQWQIFSYLLGDYKTIVNDEKHPLFAFIQPMYEDVQKIEQADILDFSKQQNQSEPLELQGLEQRFWQFAGDMASMLNRYMTYRTDWLALWGNGKMLNVAELITKKDVLQSKLQHHAVETPEWLKEHYEILEKAQRFLWCEFFQETYEKRQKVQQDFWQNIEQNFERYDLPSQVILFTVQQLPPNELDELRRLSQYMSVTLLHFNPSEQFWADIVDKNWFLEQQLTNPDAIYLKDYGHSLLSRFGKQSREVFALLANYSGNEDNTEWHDNFVEDVGEMSSKSVLAQLQNDILMLDETDTAQKIGELVHIGKDNEKLQQKREYEEEKSKQAWRLHQIESKIDNSLAIHACHSIVRQLEVLRGQIVAWLNADKNRELSDILVLLPNIEQARTAIEAVFPKDKGADGFTLPAKVTGVTNQAVNQLWHSVTGYYTLLNQVGARFNRADVFDWLMLPPMYESFGLSVEQMRRACSLLQSAGFVRGFDETHLRQSLHSHDDDYRYTFAYALERLVAGLLMPNSEMVRFGYYQNLAGDVESIEPLAGLSLADKPIVIALCDIYQTLQQNRSLLGIKKPIHDWLNDVENLMQAKFSIFKQSQAWKTIFASQNQIKNQLKANHVKANRQNKQSPSNLHLNLNFVLHSIDDALVTQQVRAEPSGMITFARIGAVRNIPYKLVVMLNLNLSEFPQQEPPNRYNLMQAGISKRGDRFREDDDLGAFLDAILCARQACWLFYNYKSMSDTHEHLPASPVQELLGFLQNQTWQSDNVHLTENFGKQVLDYFITEHPALPFDEQYFSAFLQNNLQSNSPKNAFWQQKMANNPPAKTWYQLYHALHHLSNKQANDKVELWQKSKLEQWLKHWQKQPLNLNALSIHQQNHHDVQFIQLNQLIKAGQNPAQSFTQAQKLFTYRFGDISEAYESLNLDSLSKYALNDALITGLSHANTADTAINSALAFNDILPSGVNRYQVLQQQETEFQQAMQDFYEQLQQIGDFLENSLSNKSFKNLQNQAKQLDRQSKNWLTGLMTATEPKTFAVNIIELNKDGNFDKADFDKQAINKIMITANLPNDEADYWLNYLPNSGAERHQLAFWLQHLCWQVARKTSEQQVTEQHGFSLWRYQGKTLYLPAIAWQTAYGWLQDWLMFWQLSQHKLLVLPPKTTLNYLREMLKTEKQQADDKAQKTTDLIKEWITGKFGSNSTIENFDFETWQQLIGEQKPTVILRFLQSFATWLYQPLQSYLVDIGEQIKKTK